MVHVVLGNPTASYLRNQSEGCGYLSEPYSLLETCLTDF